MEVTGRITKTSRLFQFLIKICFIPVSVKSEEIVFKVFSLKMLLYILSAVLWIIFTQMMMFVFMKQEDFDRFISEVTYYILKHSLKIFFSKVCLRGSVWSSHGALDPRRSFFPCSLLMVFRIWTLILFSAGIINLSGLDDFSSVKSTINLLDTSYLIFSSLVVFSIFWNCSLYYDQPNVYVFDHTEWKEFAFLVVTVRQHCLSTCCWILLFFSLDSTKCSCFNPDEAFWR